MYANPLDFPIWFLTNRISVISPSCNITKQYAFTIFFKQFEDTYELSTLRQFQPKNCSCTIVNCPWFSTLGAKTLQWQTVAEHLDCYEEGHSFAIESLFQVSRTDHNQKLPFYNFTILQDNAYISMQIKADSEIPNVCTARTPPLCFQNHHPFLIEVSI